LEQELLEADTGNYWSAIMLTTTFSLRSSPRSTKTNSWNEISALEKHFPRIANDMCTYWGSQEIDNYIDNMLLDDRGDRMGFPIDVLEELMFLAGIRWHLNHLCGTVIESTGPEAFNYSGHRTELCSTNPGTWVLL
jgi:hypothetical protein